MSLAPPILITLASLFETEPILIFNEFSPTVKVPFILSKLSTFNFPNIFSVINGSFLIRNLLFKSGIVVFLIKLISVVLFETLFVILFILVVFVKS